MISHCTTLQYNHNKILYDTILGRNDILNTKDNEFNRLAISLLWNERPMFSRGQINVAGIQRT